MKKLLAFLLLVPSLAFCDTKISNLPATTTMAQTDIIPVVTTPGSTPANKIITYQNFYQGIPSTVTAASLGALTSATAATTYLTQSSATLTYCNANGTNCTAGTTLPAGASNYAQINPSSQQSGTVSVSTVTASSVTITNSLNVTAGISAYSSLTLNTPGAGPVSGDINFLQQGNITGGKVRSLWFGGTGFASPLLLSNTKFTDSSAFTNLYVDPNYGVTILGSTNNVRAFSVGQTLGSNYDFFVTTGGVVNIRGLTNTVLATDASGNIISTTVAGGGGVSSGGYAVQPATVAFQLNQGMTASTGTFTSTVTAAAFVGTGPGNWNVTENGLTGQFVISTGTPTSGQLAVFGDSKAVVPSQLRNTLIALDSSGNVISTTVASSGGSGGGNTIASPQYQIPAYSFTGSSTALTGTPNFTNNGSTITMLNMSQVVQNNVSSVSASGVAFLYTGSTLTISAIQWPNGLQVSSPSASSGGGTWGSITGTLSSQTDLQTALTNIGTSTAAIAASTGTIQSSLTTGFSNVATSTASIATSTASLQTQATALGVSTNTLAVSTGTLYTLANGKINFSSITAVSPLVWNNATGAMSTLLTFSSMTITSGTIHNGQVTISSYAIITATNSTPALSIIAEGTYGTTASSSGGLFVKCPAGSTGGNCANIYTTAGAQTGLNPILTLNSDNAAWNEPHLYIQNSANTGNNNSDILVDDLFTPAITIRETSQSNPSAKKWQYSAHNGVERFENRLDDDSAFRPWMQVSSATFYNDVYIGSVYGGQTNTAQFRVQTGTGNINILELSTTTTVGVNLVSVSSIPAINPNDYLLNVSSTAGTMVLGVKNNGTIISSGTTPVIGTCGTTPVINPNSTNVTGSITWSGTATTCAFTFANGGYTSAPFCIADDSGAGFAELAGVTASSATFNFSTSLTGSTMTYVCIGGKGG